MRIPGSRLVAAALSAGLLGLVLAQPGTPAAALSCVPPDSSITCDGTARSDNDVYVGRVGDRGVRTTEEAFGESVDGRRYRLHVSSRGPPDRAGQSLPLTRPGDPAPLERQMA